MPRNRPPGAVGSDPGVSPEYAQAPHLGFSCPPSPGTHVVAQNTLVAFPAGPRTGPAETTMDSARDSDTTTLISPYH